MCAVIGMVVLNPNENDFKILKNVFYESRIRGLHATGISYVKNEEIHTQKKHLSSTDFEFNFEEYLNEDSNLYLIGHCRYSTSDLQYNQPIDRDGISISHNGVVTQEPFGEWKYSTETKNDSELLLSSIIEGNDIMDEWSNASISLCILYKDKKIQYMRNGKRPLYAFHDNRMTIVTSTKDIASRAGIHGSRAVNPFEINTVSEYNKIIMSKSKTETMKDLQCNY